MAQVLGFLPSMSNLALVTVGLCGNEPVHGRFLSLSCSTFQMNEWKHKSYRSNEDIAYLSVKLHQVTKLHRHG